MVPTPFRRVAGGDRCSLAVVLIWSFLALSSTRNRGDGFDLTLVPALVTLLVSAASRMRHAALLLAACTLAAMVSFAGDGGLVSTSTATSVSMFGKGFVVVDGRGSLVRYTDAFVSSPTSRTSVDTLMRAEADAGRDLAVLVIRTAATHHRSPNVALATQDPFINTNSLDLDLELADGRVPSVGLLHQTTTSNGIADQLNDPHVATPNLVVVGPNPTNPHARAFAPLSDPSVVVADLVAAEFRVVGGVALPDGRTLQVWWKDRGPP
jgi:hypothetical protein